MVKNIRKCDKYLLRSINHEKYLRKVTKTLLSIFDDKRNYLDNNTSLP